MVEFAVGLDGEPYVDVEERDEEEERGKGALVLVAGSN